MANINTTAVQGYNMKISFGVGAADISGQSNGVDLTPSRKVDDVTPFGQSWRMRMAGLKEWKGTLKIFYNEEAGEAWLLLKAAWQARVKVPLKLSPKGGSTGNFEWSGDVILADLPIKTSSDGGPVMVEVSFEGTGELEYTAIPAPP